MYSYPLYLLPTLVPSLLTTYPLPRARVCTCLASPQLARLATELERGAGLRACVRGAPPAERATEPPTQPPTERAAERAAEPPSSRDEHGEEEALEPPSSPTPSSRDDEEALRDSVSQSKGEL